MKTIGRHVVFSMSNSTSSQQAQSFLLAAIARVNFPPRKGKASADVSEERNSLPWLSHVHRNLLTSLVVVGDVSIHEMPTSEEAVGEGTWPSHWNSSSLPKGTEEGSQGRPGAFSPGDAQTSLTATGHDGANGFAMGEGKALAVCLRARVARLAGQLGVSQGTIKNQLRDLCRSGWLTRLSWTGEELEVSLSHGLLLYGELLAREQEKNHKLSDSERVALGARVRELKGEIRSTIGGDAARGKEEEKLLALAAGKQPALLEVRNKVFRLVYEMAKGCQAGRKVGVLSKELILVAAAAIGVDLSPASSLAMTTEENHPRIEVRMTEERITEEEEKVAHGVTAPETPSAPGGCWEQASAPQEGKAEPGVDDTSSSILTELPAAVARDGAYWHTPTGKQEIQLRNEFFKLAYAINPSYTSEVRRYYERNPSVADLKAKLTALRHYYRNSRT